MPLCSGSGQHRAPARPPVRPGANATISISRDSHYSAYARSCFHKLWIILALQYFFIAAKRHTAEVALRRGGAARAQAERFRRAPLQEGVCLRIAGVKRRKPGARGKREAVPPPELYLLVSIRRAHIVQLAGALDLAHTPVIAAKTLAGALRIARARVVTLAGTLVLACAGSIGGTSGRIV